MKRPRQGGRSSKTDKTDKTGKAEKPKPWGSNIPSAPVYDFRRLANFDPNFRKHVEMHENGSMIIDFSQRATTAAVTVAILRQHFSLSFSLPAGHLIPTIPSRVQYLRWATGLLPPNYPLAVHTVLDVGTGSSSIYTLLGARLYPFWHFVGTDTDASALAVAKGIVATNGLKDRISLMQTAPGDPLLSSSYWGGSESAVPALTLCNPPFFDEVPHTADAAGVAAGIPAQLATAGGEVEFVKKLARESVSNPEIAVFSSLIGLKTDLATIVSFLRSDEIHAYQVASAKLKAGSRTTRWAVAWSFGPRRSLVDVRGELEKSNWRAAISVSPGRKYANRMTGTAVINICRSALLSLEWKAADTQSDVDETGSETATNIVTKVFNEEKGESRLSISCSEVDESWRLNLLLKVEKRGAMRPFQVFELGQQVAAQMRITMNKPQQCRAN